MLLFGETLALMMAALLPEKKKEALIQTTEMSGIERRPRLAPVGGGRRRSGSDSARLRFIGAGWNYIPIKTIWLEFGETQFSDPERRRRLRA